MSIIFLLATGCTAAEHAQPDAGAAAAALDPEPEAYCADTCHGACGPNCNACQKTTSYSCVLDGNGQNTGYEVATEVDTCGTHNGCRIHDDCLQTCANNSGCNWSPYTQCALQCDALISSIYPSFYWLSWIFGGGPYDGTLVFNYPGAPYANPAACPPPTSGGGGGGGGGGGECDYDACEFGCCDYGCCDEEDDPNSIRAPGHHAAAHP